MWDGMYQMNIANNSVAVERHKSLPEINEIIEWKEKERMFERRNSFTAIPNTKKKSKGRRRCHRSGSTRSVDSGYITQTILNEQIAWSREEVNFSSKTATAVNCKKKTISLRNSIQALLDANDNLVTDSYKTLSDAEEWSKSHDTMPQPDMKGLFNGKTGSLCMLEQIGKCVNVSDDMMSSLLRQTTYSAHDEHESEMLEYSYTIDAELSYQEYNKLMQIIIMILQEKKKWEEYIKEAEVKLTNSNNEKSELVNNNKVLKESLETANSAINDINCKVQKLKESLGQLREENNSLRRENKELKVRVNDLEDMVAEKVEESCQDMASPKKELIEYKRNMHDKFNKLEEAYRSYRKEMETKHADMNRTVDEVRQLYDSATCSIDELKNENLILKAETDIMSAKNEQLTEEVQERQEDLDTMAARNETLTTDIKQRLEDVDTLVSTNAILTSEKNMKQLEVDAFAAKIEKLTTEMKRKLGEAAKKLESEKAERQIQKLRTKEIGEDYKKQLQDKEEDHKKQLQDKDEDYNGQLQDKNEDYKKQLQDKNTEIEKQKWEVFFYKEESAALEKENTQLKSNLAELETKIKDVQGRNEAFEKEVEQEMQRNGLLKTELEDVRKDSDELREIRRQNMEINMEVQIYKKQASTHQLLRNELESLKRDNLSQISENESLKAQVAKLKIEAIEAASSRPPPLEMDTKRLLKEMENLRNQLQVLDGNQDNATADCVATKTELEKMRKELNSFVDNMHQQSKEKDANTIIEDISELKLQMSELEYLSRSKVINCVLDSETSSNGSRISNEFSDFKYQGEKESSSSEDVKKVRPKIQLVIRDDVVQWIDAPNEGTANQETVEMEDAMSEDSNSYTEEQQLEMVVPPPDNPQLSTFSSTNIDTNIHSQDMNDIKEDENEARPVKEVSEPNTESVDGIKNEEVEEDDTEMLPHPPKEMYEDTSTFPRVEIVKHLRRSDGEHSSGSGSSSESQSERSVEILIRSPSTSSRNSSADSAKFNNKTSRYGNIEKHSSTPLLLGSPSLKKGLRVTHSMNHAMNYESDDCQTKADDNDPFNNVSSIRHQTDSQALPKDDHIYAEVANKKAVQRGTPQKAHTKKVYGNCNSLRGRTTSHYSGRKGLSRTNTYLCSDYQHVNKGRGCDNRSNKMVDQGVEVRRPQSTVQKLKANSTEAVQSASRGSPVKTKLSRTIASLSSHDNVANQKCKNTSTDGEWKPALPVRNTSLRLMSKKKPNELFQDKKSRAMIREEDAECVDRETAYSRHDSTRIPHSIRKPVTIKRAQSVKVKGEELYASIRKKTADETKEKFIERMNSINDVERLQIERMESARHKLTGKALQEEVTSRNNTIKRKSLQSKSSSNSTASSVQSKGTLNPTGSITIHGIPVRRNARRNSDYENDVSEPTSRRHSADGTTEKKISGSKLRRVASLSKKSALAGEFKHLKDGIKTHLHKSKGYSQKTFEFFTEEAVKKYKYARDTLKSKNFCLKSEKPTPLRRSKEDSCNSVAQNHAEDVLKEIRDMTASYEPRKAKADPLNKPKQNGSLPTEKRFSTKSEAIYENTSSYTNINAASDPSLPKRSDTSPKNRFSLSDADLTSLSRDEGQNEDQMSWEHYYPVGETTPKHSLLSLV